MADGDEELERELTALASWAGFPAGVSPRPLVLTGRDRIRTYVHTLFGMADGSVGQRGRVGHWCRLIHRRWSIVVALLGVEGSKVILAVGPEFRQVSWETCAFAIALRS